MSRSRSAVALVLLFGAVALARGQTGDVFLNRPLTQWQRDLKDKRPAVRRSAAFALGKIGNHGTVMDLLKALHDTDPGVREASAFALGELGLPLIPDTASDALSNLVEALSDKDARVRRSAAYAIGKYGPRAFTAAPQLRTCLEDGDAEVRQNAAWALGELAVKADRGTAREFAPPVDRGTVAGLDKLLAKDPDPLVRRDAAQSLGKIGRRARPALRTLLAHFHSDQDAVVSRTALDALVNVVGAEDTDLADDLRPALKDHNPDVVREAAFALANIGGEAAEDALPVLQHALKDKDAVTRRLAVTALANVGPPAVADLTAALDDPDAEVRRGAAVGLSRVGAGAARAAPGLVKVLVDSAQPQEVRKYAAEALADVTPKDPDVVAALLRVLAEKGNYEVRHRVIWGLMSPKDFAQPGVAEGLTAVLDEGAPEARLLRYDAAATLCSRLGSRVPDKALDVMLAALKDDTISVYQGTGVRVSDTGSEAKTGEAQVKENGSGDYRRMVAGVLALVGKRASRPDILAALRKVRDDSFDPDARKAARMALEVLGKEKEER